MNKPKTKASRTSCIPTAQEIRLFRGKVWRHWKAHGRNDLPWRKTTDPYNILVSEIMLQQTQVERVVPFYRAFVRRFPNVRALARASRREVLALWSGLGYNRRARFLHEAAVAIVAQGGNVPEDTETLMQLPGIGAYTAGAIRSFAFNQPDVCVETNIRTVYIHTFFADQSKVSDAELVPLIAATVSRKHPREWYWALMDYGAWLKQNANHTNARSAHYVKQKPFKGSDRAIRGAVIRALVNVHKELPMSVLLRMVDASAERVRLVVEELAREGMLRKKRNVLSL